MWRTIYNALPDFSGVLLAAVGVALVISPEAIKRIEQRKKLRGTTALLLVTLGLAGVRSSCVQRKEGEDKQNELKIGMHNLQTTVDTFGPKLDAIISETNPSKRRAEAITLKAEIKGEPRIQPKNSSPQDNLPSVQTQVKNAAAGTVVPVTVPNGAAGTITIHATSGSSQQSFEMTFTTSGGVLVPGDGADIGSGLFTYQVSGLSLNATNVKAGTNYTLTVELK